MHVHEKVLKKYASSFMNQPRYRIERPTDQWLELSTTIYFLHKGIKLEIDKTAEVEVFSKGRETARTLTYSYNVSDEKGNFFRYCSPHEDHRPYHHKHLYDPITRIELLPPDRVNEESVPHIDEVIEEILKLK